MFYSMTEIQVLRQTMYGITPYFDLFYSMTEIQVLRH